MRNEKLNPNWQVRNFSRLLPVDCCYNKHQLIQADDWWLLPEICFDCQCSGIWENLNSISLWIRLGNSASCIWFLFFTVHEWIPLSDWFFPDVLFYSFYSIIAKLQNEFRWTTFAVLIVHFSSPSSTQNFGNFWGLWNHWESFTFEVQVAFTEGTTSQRAGTCASDGS